MGATHDVVGDRLGLRHLGDLLHDVLEGLHVLDVDRRDDVDAGREQPVDVLPALGVAAVAGRVGVGEVVDEHDLRGAGEHRVQVQLGELAAAAVDAGALHDVEPGRPRLLEQGFRVRAPVALHEAHDDVGAVCGPSPSFVEHAAGLAYPRCRTEVDLQLSGSYVRHRAGVRTSPGRAARERDSRPG